MSADRFGVFYANLLRLTDSEQQRYAPSILGVFMLDKRDIKQTDIWEKNHTSISLYYLNTALSQDIKEVSCGGTIWKYNPNPTGDNNREVLYTNDDMAVTLNTPFELSEDRIGANIFCSFSNGAKFTVDTTALQQADKTINKIGYTVAFNPEGHAFRYYLRINEHTYSDNYVDMPMANLLTMAYDSSVSRASDYVGSALGVIAGLAMVGSILGGVAGAGAGLSTANLWGLGSEASAAVSAAAKSAAFPLAMAGTNIASAAGGIAQTTAQHQQGTYSTIGGTGWSIDKAQNTMSRVIITYFQQPELQTFQSMYGKPDYHMRNLSTLTGYVLTAGARLSSPTGHLSIGTRAIDAALNGSGVFILS